MVGARSQGQRRRSLVVVAGVAVMLALGLGAGRWLGRWTSEWTGPAAGAEWIWAAGSFDRGLPIAFFAIGEVTLDVVPAAARLAITADEDYRLYVNDAWVAAGAYQPGHGLDVYEVGALLHAGRNRLVVELRSSRGAGGLLAALSSDQEQPLLVTDGGWRIARRYRPDLFRSRLPLVEVADLETEAARVWGAPRVGRWRVGRTPVVRKRWFSPAVEPALSLPVRALRPEPGARWQRVAATRPRLPRAARAIDTIFAWPGEVTGVLVLDLREAEHATALVRVASSLDELEATMRDQRSLLMIPVPGAPYWRAPAALRFRYLEVSGVALSRRPSVLETLAGIPTQATADAYREPPGVLGLAPLWRPSRAKQAVTQRLRPAPKTDPPAVSGMR